MILHIKINYLININAKFKVNVFIPSINNNKSQAKNPLFAIIIYNLAKNS